jgi:hypothetical protein
MCRSRFSMENHKQTMEEERKKYEDCLKVRPKRVSYGQLQLMQKAEAKIAELRSALDKMKEKRPEETLEEPSVKRKKAASGNTEDMTNTTSQYALEPTTVGIKRSQFTSEQPLEVTTARTAKPEEQIVLPRIVVTVTAVPEKTYSVEVSKNGR